MQEHRLPLPPSHNLTTDTNQENTMANHRAEGRIVDPASTLNGADIIVLWDDEGDTLAVDARLPGESHWLPIQMSETHMGEAHEEDPDDRF